MTGLNTGGNTITARQGNGSSSLNLINYLVTGPVFAGPKEQPFYCETTRFKLVDGTYLPEPLDEDCSVKTTVTYVYKSVTGDAFKPLPDRTQLPDDIATTAITTGEKVPYVVRVEAGTIDRGIYQIAMLHNPVSDPEPSPFRAARGWNKRMVYVFGGGCSGMYRQGARTATILDDQLVGQGYVVVANSLNVFANNCDDLLAAESMMMTREHAIELVGAPLYTLGWGCSGGSHQVLQISDNYPGLMDGIIPLCTSVDVYRLAQHVLDMRLLLNWFETPAGRALTQEQQHAVFGSQLESSVGATVSWDATSCDGAEGIPAGQIFDAKTNPTGIRCSLSDHQINALGRDPATGFAWSSLDNTGVQYGLTALQSGVISAAEFLSVNEQVGGYDEHGALSPKRAVAPAPGLEAIYRTGRLLTAEGGLKDVPIVELRNYSDMDASATHLKSATYALTERLERAVGGRANHVILLESHGNGYYSASRTGGDALSRYALGKMDQWLTALVADEGPGTQQEKVIRTKPEDLIESCYGENNTRIIEEQTFSGGKCNALYPTHPTPRMVAGGPLSQDVLKCQLKPVDGTGYGVDFSEADLARLNEIFPDGVCDWSKPGVGQVPLAGTWQSF